ncbi:MAG: hypothetical protein ACTHYN_01075 [Marinobacter sp.]|uniref:hypothetical protein n=1 Tax=Marinobacter sp. TaxID=50741 RepID=UPI003F9795B6
MRLIILLIALMIVGLLVTTNLSKRTQPSTESSTEPPNSGVPKIPVNPQDVQQFEKDMNAFIENKTSKQAKEIDRATQ